MIERKKNYSVKEIISYILLTFIFSIFSPNTYNNHSFFVLAGYAQPENVKRQEIQNHKNLDPEIFSTFIPDEYRNFGGVKVLNSFSLFLQAIASKSWILTVLIIILFIPITTILSLIAGLTYLILLIKSLISFSIFKFFLMLLAIFIGFNFDLLKFWIKILIVGFM
jgi:hypothetical protein